MKIAFIVLAIVLVLIFIVAPTEAENYHVDTIKVFDAVVMAGSVSSTSAAVNLDQRQPIGFFSIQMNVTGTGVVTAVNYEISNDGANFSTPVGVSPIVTNFGTNSGANADGNSTYQIQPVIGRFFRIVATATGTSVIVDGTLAIQ